MPAEAPTAVVVTRATERDRSRWDRFVCGHRDASFCHLYDWKRVFEAAYRKRCYFLCAHRDGEVEGVLPLVWMNGPIGGNRLFSLPFLDRGGILANSAAAAEALRRAAVELCSDLGAGGVDLQGDWGESPGHDGPQVERYSLVLPLTGPEEILWKAVGPKVRNQVRKSRKSGLATRRVAAAELGAFYSVWARNMRDLGSPVHSRAFFEQIFSVFGPAVSLYLTADSRGSVVAGAIAIRFGDTVTVPWASALRAVRSSCPNHSLYWETLRDSLGDGATVFDFGRSRAGSGTFHFKKQWGAEPQPLAWVSVARDGRVLPGSVLDRRSYATVVKLWSRLPVGLATLLGPLVRRHIAN